MSDQFRGARVAIFLALIVQFSSASAESLRPAKSEGAASDDRYFVVLLSHQSAENEIRWSHTFASS